MELQILFISGAFVFLLVDIMYFNRRAGRKTKTRKAVRRDTQALTRFRRLISEIE